MTALVEREAMVVAPQHQADEVPRMRVQAAAVEEENRLAAGLTPVEVMEAHLMDHDLMGFRQDDFGDFQSGIMGRQLKMFDLFGIVQHATRSWSVSFEITAVKRRSGASFWGNSHQPQLQQRYIAKGRKGPQSAKVHPEGRSTVSRRAPASRKVALSKAGE